MNSNVRAEVEGTAILQVIDKALGKVGATR